MKIELNDVEEVAEFLAMLCPQFYHRARERFNPSPADTGIRTTVRNVDYDGQTLPTVVRAADEAAQTEGLPTDIAKPDAPEPVEAPAAALLRGVNSVDSTGRKWDARIDSSNKGLNADGTWRARRNHGLSADEVAAIKAEMLVAAEPTADPDPEVTTETHPLPVQGPETPEPEVEAPVQEAAAPLDLDEVLIKGAELAQDASDSHMDVLSASREFISAFDLDIYNAVKAATVEGKALQTLTPGERRLLIGTLNAYTQANGTPDAS